MARRAARAYLFLRRLENRLQMLRDAQTHACRRTRDRLRWRGLGYATGPRCCMRWPRSAPVSAEFAALLAPRRRQPRPTRWPTAGARVPAGDAGTAGRRRLRSMPAPTSAARFRPGPACAGCPMRRVRGWIGCCRRC
jgi:hypothetical protein